MSPARAPHHTVLPVVGRKPPASTTSSMPTAASTLRLLGGSDSARPRAWVDRLGELEHRVPALRQQPADRRAGRTTTDDDDVESGHLIIWSFGH